MHRWGSVVTIAAVAAALVLAPLPTTPSALGNADVRDLDPPPGGVVAAGEVEVRARIAGGPEPAEATVAVRGEEPVDAQIDGREIRATIDVPTGSQLIELEADTASRTWRVAASDVQLSRLFGDDRYATAAAVSADVHADGSADAAVLARGDDFADALAGAPLAVAVGGPLLLATSDGLPEATADELSRVVADGGDVWLLGGEAALGSEVAEAVEELGLAPRRLAGDTRFTTAAEVATQLDAVLRDDEPDDEEAEDDAEDDSEAGEDEGTGDDDGSNDEGSEDADEAEDAETTDEAQGDDNDGATGEADGNDDGSNGDGDDANGDDTDGDDANDEEAEDDADDADDPRSAPRAILASGRVPADALAAAAPAAAAGTPILLTEPDTLPASTEEALADTDEVVIVGGEAAVSADVADAARGTGAEVRRLAGDTRYETAAEIAADLGPEEPAGVALASGTGFADALAGAPHAAVTDRRLLLADGDRLPAGGDLLLADTLAYGGPAVLPQGLERGLHLADVSAGAPQVEHVSPAPGSTVTSLDEIEITVGGAVDANASSLSPRVDGADVRGSRTADDGTLTFTVASVPDADPWGEVTVDVAAGLSVDGGWRHHEWSFTYRVPAELRPGDIGPAVERLQEELLDAGYWHTGVDGRYGLTTRHAVIALQKAEGLDRTGRVDYATWEVLDEGAEPPRPRSRSGRVLEVDLERQLLLIAENGQTRKAIHVSTGHGEVYEFQGALYRGTTTMGRHRITRQIDGIREAERGELYRPKYYDDSRGIAFHGYPSVPTYPASSGCIRMSNPAMDMLWDSGLAPVGTSVWVYPEDFY